MSRLSVPTKGRLPPSLRVDTSSVPAQKILSRLSRPALLSLALDWLDSTNLPLAAPYLRPRRDDDDEGGEDEEDDALDDFYPPARSARELRQRYLEMQALKGSKKEVVDRMVEGDWRHGLTLYQLAMADLQYLYDHPGSQKWSAYRVVPLKAPGPDHDETKTLEVDKESLVVPRFHPSTFLKNLHASVLPDVKVHYNMDRPKDMPLLLLRIFILDSPYNTDLALTAADSYGGAPANFEASRTIYIAFPDASPFIYISKSQVLGANELGETKSLRSLVVEGIPKALSRPRERYTLKSTNFSTRNLSALLNARGARRTNFAWGGWSIYADEKTVDSPLNTLLPTPPLSDAASEAGASEHGTTASRKRKTTLTQDSDERLRKRARVVAQARFGNTAKLNDGKGVERVDILIEDPFPEFNPVSEPEDEEEDQVQDARTRSKKPRRSNIDMAFEREAETLGKAKDANGQAKTEWYPDLRLTLTGNHVFAGIRQLVEAGIIDGDRMPGWLTGEDGVTIGAVRHGRIRGHKGSGI